MAQTYSSPTGSGTKPKIPSASQMAQDLMNKLDNPQVTSANNAQANSTPAQTEMKPKASTTGAGIRTAEMEEKTNKLPATDGRTVTTQPATNTAPTASSGGGGGGGGKKKTTTPEIDPEAQAEALRQAEEARQAQLAKEQADRTALREALIGDTTAPELARYEHYDPEYMKNLLKQELDTAQEQYNGQVDRAADSQATALRRALEEAQGQYKATQEQIDRGEQTALDNSALYAQARGDNGGIGQAQYNSVQNSAQQNRVAVRNAQTQLANETAHNIADLRAQGEFDKADKALSMTQAYLAQLRSIEEYANSYNLNVDQLNNALTQWETEYSRAMQQFKTSTELSLAQVTGTFEDGTPTLANMDKMQGNLAQMALSLVQQGMEVDKLTASQRQALEDVYGMDAGQIGAYYQLLNASKKRSGGGGGGGGGSGSGSGGNGTATLRNDVLLEDGNKITNQLASGEASLSDITASLQEGINNGTYSYEEAVHLNSLAQQNALQAERDAYERAYSQANKAVSDSKKKAEAEQAEFEKNNKTTMDYIYNNAPADKLTSIGDPSGGINLATIRALQKYDQKLTK